MSSESSPSAKPKGKAPPHAWKPGQSGNPGGRPKVLAEVRKAAQLHGARCIAKLWEIACRGKTDAAKVAAIREILDRGYGKPQQLVELNAAGVNFAALVQQAQEVAADEADEETGLTGAV